MGAAWSLDNEARGPQDYRTKPRQMVILRASIEATRRSPAGTQRHPPRSPRGSLGRLRADPAPRRLVRRRPPAQGEPGMLPRPVVCPGQRHPLGDAPPRLPLVQDRAAAAEAVAGVGLVP